MNITSHFLRHVAMLMMLACALLASAQSDAIVSVEAGDTMGDNTESVSNDTVSSGFNALDYVLQRPNRNQFYKPKKFGDHLFIALEAGTGWFHNPERLFDFEGTDAKFGINVGDWVTPVHGWRVGINGGSHRLMVDTNHFTLECPLIILPIYQLSYAAITHPENSRS